MELWIVVVGVAFVIFGISNSIRSRGFETAYAVDNAIISLYESDTIYFDVKNQTVSVRTVAQSALTPLAARVIDRGFRGENTVTLKRFRRNALLSYKQYHQAVDAEKQLGIGSKGVPVLRIRKIRELDSQAGLIFKIVFASDDISTS